MNPTPANAVVAEPELVTDSLSTTLFDISEYGSAAGFTWPLHVSEAVVTELAKAGYAEEVLWDLCFDAWLAARGRQLKREPAKQVVFESVLGEAKKAISLQCALLVTGEAGAPTLTLALESEV